MRESPAIEILRQLVKQGAYVQVNDPHISSFDLDGQVYESQPLTAELLEEADLTVITTDHSAYDYSLIGKKAKLIFDTRNGLKDVQQIRGDYERI